MKKIILAVLSLLLLAGLVYVYMSRRNASEQDETKPSTSLPPGTYVGENNDVYVVDDAITEIKSYAFSSFKGSKVILPKGLKKIGSCAFVGSDVEEIEIPAGVKEIEDSTFFMCHRLKRIKLNEGLTSIGEMAFAFCDSLTEHFVLPSTVKKIGCCAFGIRIESEHSIESHYLWKIAQNIEIPKNSQLKEVGYDGLEYAKKVFIPKSLHNINGFGNPFFEVPKDHPDFCCIDGVLYNKDTTVLLRFPKEKGGNYRMPNSVRIVDDDAFQYNTKLETIELSSNLDSIKQPLTIFYGNLKNVNIPTDNQKFRSIDGVLFSHDASTLLYYPQGRNDEEYVVPESVRFIGMYSFQMCQTKKITMPKRLELVPDFAFYEPLKVNTVIFTGGKCNMGDDAIYIDVDGSDIENIVYAEDKESDEDDDEDEKTVEVNDSAEKEDTKEEKNDNLSFEIKPSRRAEDKIDPRGCKETLKSLGNTNGHKYVDLGLPSGMLWAETNLGGQESTDFGKRYAWGDDAEKTTWDDSNYKFFKQHETGKNESGVYTKYVLNKKFGYNDFSDNKYMLDLEDDTAHEKMGGSWRIPTECEWWELLDNCKLELTVYQGVNGYMVTGKNGNKLFLPAAGCGLANGIGAKSMLGYYWTSTIWLENQTCARALTFSNERIDISGCLRKTGFSIRAVCPVSNKQ